MEFRPTKKCRQKEKVAEQSFQEEKSKSNEKTKGRFKFINQADC